MGSRIIFFCLLLTVSLSGSSGFCQPDSALPAAGQKIRIAYNIGNPPIKFENNGHADGMLIDIWRLWSQKTGIPVEFKKALFSETLEMVQNGEADVHGGMFFTPERDLIFDFTAPILDISYMIYFHESISGIHGLQDLSSFKIGVPEGYTRTFVEKNVPGAALAVYRNFPELFAAAEKGEIKVFLSPAMNHQYYLQTQKSHSPFLYDPGRPAYTRTYFGAVRQGNRALLEKIDQGFQLIHQDERVEIQRKWLKGDPRLSGREKLMIACNSDFAPFSFINTRGQPAGMFVDIWRLWARRMNVDIQFLFNSHGGSIQDLKNGLADFHCGFPTADHDVLVSDPFYHVAAGIFVPMNTVYQTVSDLSGARIAAIDEHYADILKTRNFNIQIIFLNDFREVLNRLNSGSIDGFVANKHVVTEMLHHQGRHGEFKTISDFHAGSDVSAVLLKKNSRLEDTINHGLNLISEKEYLQIEDQWLTHRDQSYFRSRYTRFELTDAEQQWLAKHPTVRLGIDPHYYPYEFFDQQGRSAGAAADYMELVRKKLGIRFEVIRGASWQQVMEMAENRELDIVPAVNQTPERSGYLIFTEPYLNYPVVCVTQKETAAIDRLADFSGRKVALVSDYAYTELLLRAVPDIQKHYVRNVAEGLKSVAEGKAEAIVGDLASLAYQIQKYNLINLKINSQVDIPARGLAVGVRNDEPLLANILEKVLASISEEEHIRIRNKWVALDLPEKVAAVSKIPAFRPVRLTPGEKRFIQEHPVVTIGVDPLFIPFEFFDETGKYSGIASDYVRLLNERLGIHMQVVPDLTWNEAFEKARRGEIDVLPCVGVTRERLGLFHYSLPYSSRYVVMITRLDGPMVFELPDLRNRKIAVEKNTFHEGFVREQAMVEPLVFPDMKQALLAVSSAKADVFIGDVAASSYWIKKMHLTNLKVVGPADFKPQTLHFAVQKKYPELVSMINKGLESILPEEKSRIRSRWISLEYEPGMDPVVFWRYFLIGLFCSMIILAIFLLWNYSLKKEIHERKQAQKKIAEYAAELKETNIQLESLDKLKSMFIASMSHELRTPLNSIIGFTGVILQGMSGEINDQQKDQLNRVYTSAKHLLNLISDVIDISKIEAGKIDVYAETFDLDELIDEAVLNIQPQLTQKQMALDIRNPGRISVTTDRKRLLQCLINYLSNAVKYSESGTVTVCVEELESVIEISVSDTGIGIPQTEVSKLFNAFERVNSRLKVKAGGAGLGLYLTKKLAVEVLGGSVSVKSREGEGSKFGIKFPRHLKMVSGEAVEK